MRKLLAKARTRLGWAVIGSAATLALGGVATAAVMTPATDEVSDVSTVTTDPAPTTEVAQESTPALTTGASAPVEQPEQAAPTSTVPGVTTTPQRAPAPQAQQPADDGAAASTPYDPTAPFTDQAGNTYLPAPEVPVPPLPGEPNYVPPGG